VRGWRSWDEEEHAQCLSRLVGSVIPFVVVFVRRGHIFYVATVALLQTASLTVTQAVLPKY
jgi:hypothetical protein